MQTTHEQGEAREVAAIGVGRAARPALASLRARMPGSLEAMVYVGGADEGEAWMRRRGADGDIVRVGLAAPRDPAVVAAAVAETVRGAVLVTWSVADLVARLGCVVPAPRQVIAEASAVMELAPIAALWGAVDDAGQPTEVALAARLGVEAPARDARAEALFAVKVARRLIAGGDWLVQLVGLAPDERAILRLSAQRLLAGQRVYGRWSVADGRAYEREGLEEVVDALHYAAAGLLRSAPRVRRARGA